MFKNRSVIISGSTGSGKSTLIHKYLEYLNKEEHEIYVIDVKGIEYFKYKKDALITVIDDDVETKILEELKPLFEKRMNNSNKHAFLIIDECADLFYNKEIKKFVKFVLAQRFELNTDVILTSQLKSIFKKELKDLVDVVMELKN